MYLYIKCRFLVLTEFPLCATLCVLADTTRASSAIQPNKTAAAGYRDKAKVNSLIAHLYFAATPSNVLHSTITSNGLAAGVTATSVTPLVST